MEMNNENKVTLTKKEVVKSWARYYLSAEVSSSYERLTALGFAYGMLPALKKLYGNDKNELDKALQRHLSFYNSEATWGSLLFGITLALEEERANTMNQDSEIQEEATDMITNLKIGLMGPLAGIGDTIEGGTIKPIILALFIPMAAAGSGYASIISFLIYGIAVSSLAYFLVMKGYSLGKQSIVSILQSGKINQLINAASVLGLFMMGALSASYVKLSTVLMIDSGAGVFKLQEIFNKFIPNFLPLCVVFCVYLYIKKSGPKYVRILLTILLLSIFFSFLGIV
jgi:D-glucosaminate-specific PTS system IID component